MSVNVVIWDGYRPCKEHLICCSVVFSVVTTFIMLSQTILPWPKNHTPTNSLQTGGCYNLVPWVASVGISFF